MRRPRLDSYNGRERRPCHMSFAPDAASSGPPRGWPRPPFDWPHHEEPRAAGAWACAIDTVEGRWLQAFARDVDPRAREWSVGPKAGGPFVPLPLSRIARVTLGAVLKSDLAPIPIAGTHQKQLKASLVERAAPVYWHGVVRTLDGRRAPTWFVSYTWLGSWGIDTTGRVQAAVDSHYRPVGSVCGIGVYLHDGDPRPLPPLPHPSC